MNRRAFLRLMGLSSAGVFAGVLDPDLLTWQPGAKVYSLPPVGVFDEAQLGISIRFVRDYSVIVDAPPTRYDFWYGYANPAQGSIARDIDAAMLGRTVNP